ncbi:L-arabinose transport system permease protein AraQ [Meiothermus luteus]|jgi:multiple sugar transport system permease protein|uniref:L-arabinose transport system permease protein AraQ n=1 Tax=Meiothermus luteus TaxID=2026184 RepID=A0A399ETH7_9DEIN|nr:carbohydrate ABC transporter permease [Meiothermus luteus]RIH87025.1 L-arabinose transport system permease protein AraQ [Meiothermus luteus]RMH54981.1 MAG: ABC transporter permease subunit [Deinococcota bacterium]
MRRLATLLLYLALLLGSVVMFFPFVWMFLTSLKPFAEIFELKLLPQAPTLENYREVLFDTQFPRWFFNSLLVASITTLSVLFFDALVGYTLAKLRFPGRGFVFVLILSTLMVPTEMLVIPWYVMSTQYGWVNTYWGLLFPGLISAFGVFLMRQFFETLPTDLLDAGRIDGLSEFGVFWRIAFPLVRPALAALGIFTFLGNWNAFLWPLIVVQTPEMRTVPIGVALFSSEAGTAWNLIMAASSLAVLPVLLVFFFFQRQIIEGVVLTGVKG